MIDTAGDVAAVISRIEDAVTQRVDAIVINVDPAQVGAGLQAAAAAGIPVVGMDAGSDPLIAANVTGWMIYSTNLVRAHIEEKDRSGEKRSVKEGVRMRYADMRLKTFAARSMLYRTARLAERGENVVNEAIACKVFATEAVTEVVDIAIQLVGGQALVTGHPLESLYRQIRALRLAEGASDVLRLNLVRGDLELGKGRL